MDYEKNYEEALERAKGIIKYYKEHNRKEASIEDLETIFPELKESEDETIRKNLITFFKNEYGPDSHARFAGIKVKDVIAWLEKQKEYVNDLSPEQEAYLMSERFKQAEKEKDDFTTRQFLQCLASFDKFIEGEHYWLEYIGGDMYIGRSDNVLGEKFHITPRQLFTLFSDKIEEVSESQQETKWSPSKKQIESLGDLLKYNIGVFDYKKFKEVNSLYDDLTKILDHETNRQKN